MSNTSLTREFNARLTTTADKIHKSGAVQDAVSDSNVIFSELMAKGKIKEKTVGGELIRVGLMYEHNEPDAYAGYDPIDVSPVDGITAAHVPWAQYGGSVTIDGMSRHMNAGKEKIADLMKEKVTQLTAGWAHKFQKDVWDVAGLTAVHPYTGKNGKQMISLPLYVQADPTNDTYDIGGIDQSVNTWWQNQAFDGDGATSAALLKKTMSNAYNSLGNGPHGTPDLLVGNQGFYELYEESMQDQVRYSYKDKASAGFESLTYKNAKLMWDGFVPDPEAGVNGALAGGAVANNTLYMFNTKTMKLYVGKDHDFKPRGFQTPVDQDASTSLYLCYLQLVCDNRRKNGVLFDLPIAFS